MSFEAKQDLQVESIGNRQDRVRPNRDASEEMLKAPDLIAEYWISRGISDEMPDVSDSAFQIARILTSDRENLADKESPGAPERRDWKNLYCCGQIQDRLLAPAGSAPHQTARSALKSILQKHHARVKSGQDRLLDLRDF